MYLYNNTAKKTIHLPSAHLIKQDEMGQKFPISRYTCTLEMICKIINNNNSNNEKKEKNNIFALNI